MAAPVFVTKKEDKPDANGLGDAAASLKQAYV